MSTETVVIPETHRPETDSYVARVFNMIDRGYTPTAVRTARESVTECDLVVEAETWFTDPDGRDEPVVLAHRALCDKDLQDADKLRVWLCRTMDAGAGLLERFSTLHDMIRDAVYSAKETGDGDDDVLKIDAFFAVPDVKDLQRARTFEVTMAQNPVKTMVYFDDEMVGGCTELRLGIDVLSFADTPTLTVTFQQVSLTRPIAIEASESTRLGDQLYLTYKGRFLDTEEVHCAQR